MAGLTPTPVPKHAHLATVSKPRQLTHASVNCI